jgi:hypothetical protein
LEWRQAAKTTKHLLPSIVLRKTMQRTPHVAASDLVALAQTHNLVAHLIQNARNLMPKAHGRGKKLWRAAAAVRLQV